MKILLIFAFALSLLCSSCKKSGAGELPKINAADSETNPASTPAPPQVRIFTASDLTKYVQRNGAELDKMLGGQRIMVSGAVKNMNNEYVELSGANEGTINCRGAIFIQDEWKKLNAYYSEFQYERAPRPMATVSGVYKKSAAPSAFLEDCRIETATK